MGQWLPDGRQIVYPVPCSETMFRVHMKSSSRGDELIRNVKRKALNRKERPMRELKGVWIVIAVVIAATVLWFVFQAVKEEPIGGNKIGMVLMHGKGGNTKYVDSLASGLRSAGVKVETPLMPWSRNRIYDRTYDDSMLEIDAAIKRLKFQGAERIVVGGHSLGANAALGYAARRKGLAGVVLLAYGHVPSGRVFSEKLRLFVAQAQSMIDAGNGNKVGSFGDLNQGGTSTRLVSANIYYSWFAPNGPASDKTNAANVKEGTPVLWVSGDRAVQPRCPLR